MEEGNHKFLCSIFPLALLLDPLLVTVSLKKCSLVSRRPLLVFSGDIYHEGSLRMWLWMEFLNEEKNG